MGKNLSRSSIMVSIPVCHTGDEGSIPFFGLCEVGSVMATREFVALKIWVQFPAFLLICVISSSGRARNF